ncbi:MAG: phenylacetate--CoA ligase family protein [Christensenellales bacterium]|jgi:phenylacetate-CoA ligase|nr:phenylacetate--CoA ligase [Clostridia bacterium]HRU84406.1 phenylacetate--CoA ligase [Eubacteriales bacterium]
MYYDKEIETMPRSEMEALQSERLRRIVKYAYENVKLYRDKFDKAGIKPSDIKSIADLDKIPFTEKSDFRDNYPYGMVAVPMERTARVHASSGTSGKPTVVVYTKDDLDMWSDCMARLIAAVGVTSRDICQISFGYGLFTGALGLHQGMEKLGVTVVPASSGNTERQVMLLRDLGVTALVATPSYALHISEVIEKMGLDIGEFKLRVGLFGSEASSPEMHKTIEKRLKILSTDNYGLSEIIGPGVSGECYIKDGMHINEDHFLPEVVDRDTHLPLEPGKVGELVLTTLTKEGMPVLRYRTKDLTKLNYGVCACGRTTVRMDKLMGRTDDMLIIRGVNVFPSQIEGVLMPIPEIGGSYEIIVRREGALDTLEVLAEVADVSLLENYGNLEKLREKIRHNLKTVLQLDAKVRLVEPMSLKRFEGKAKRVTDLRKI